MAQSLIQALGYTAYEYSKSLYIGRAVRYLKLSKPQLDVFMYSRVHISSDTAFLKILMKPSIVQE